MKSVKEATQHGNTPNSSMERHIEYSQLVDSGNKRDIEGNMVTSHRVVPKHRVRRALIHNILLRLCPCHRRWKAVQPRRGMVKARRT